jgi:hypothetical protein
MKRLTFPEHDIEGTRHTLAYGQYRLSYEVYGSGDRVLVWMHGLMLDANLSRGLAVTSPGLAPSLPRPEGTTFGLPEPDQRPCPCARPRTMLGTERTNGR